MSTARMDAVDGATIELPRSRNGSSPQHLLTTLLGDYWLHRSEHVPAAALIALLGEFDVSLTGARAAMSRLARRGLLVMSRNGRNSAYGISPSAVDALAAGAYRFVNFGREQEAWDGQWTVASFSLSEEQSKVRYTLRSQLRWLGMAPLYDGMWVSPRPVAEAGQQALLELGVTDMTIFRATEVSGPGRVAISAWDLDEIAGRYTDFVDTFSTLRHSIEQGEVSASGALRARTDIMDTWRSFPGRDPDLPGELLPARWPRRQAHDLFVTVYDLLGQLAAIRVRQIFERSSAELAELVDFRSTADLLREGDAARRRLAASTPTQ